MSGPPLIGAAGRRRSPVATPGYPAGREPRNKAARTPRTRRPSMRSSRSCAKPARTATGFVPAR
jgi:hypothetical protein